MPWKRVWLWRLALLAVISASALFFGRARVDPPPSAPIFGAEAGSEVAEHGGAAPSDTPETRRDTPDARRDTPAAYHPTRFAEGQLEKHFAKHAAEWGAPRLTQREYLKRARALLEQDVGGPILGAVRANGDVLRYNVESNEFAVGAANGTIRTLFKPRSGLKYWKAVSRAP